jgi:uncharacterized membrane protein
MKKASELSEAFFYLHQNAIMFPWHQYFLGLLLVIAGFFHLQKPKIFLSIMPNYLPAHQLLVLLSGIAEMILGFMLVTAQGQTTASWLIALMMVIYLPIHWTMIWQPPIWFRWSKGLLWLRLVLQFGLIYWPLQYL